MPELATWMAEQGRVLRLYGCDASSGSLSAPMDGWNMRTADPDELNECLSAFERTSLAEMAGVSLMDRVDAKFTFKLDRLSDLLANLTPFYRVLSVNGAHAHSYETTYFDTPDLSLYTRHHNGLYARHKVRFRRYVATDTCFLEIKTKLNTGRTVKQRIERPCGSTCIDEHSRAFLRRAAPSLPLELEPALRVRFTRLTLVNTSAPERLTIDYGLSYSTADSRAAYPGLVIAEVKRERTASRSPFIGQMRERRIWEGSVSKYCLGIATLYPQAKRNRFKDRLRHITALAA